MSPKATILLRATSVLLSARNVLLHAARGDRDATPLGTLVGNGHARSRLSLRARLEAGNLDLLLGVNVMAVMLLTIAVRVGRAALALFFATRTKNGLLSNTAAGLASDLNRSAFGSSLESNLAFRARNTSHWLTIDEDVDLLAALGAVPLDLQSSAVILHNPSINSVHAALDLSVVDLTAVSGLSAMVVGDNQEADVRLASLVGDARLVSLDEILVLGLGDTSIAVLRAAVRANSMSSSSEDLLAEVRLSSGRGALIDIHAILDGVRSRIPADFDLTGTSALTGDSADRVWLSSPAVLLVAMASIAMVAVMR